jgi:hypothetical protein
MDAALTHWPWIVAGLVVLVVLGLVASKRGGQVNKDPQRFYDDEQRKLGRRRCGDRCEHKHPFWFRCRGGAEEADHVYPWSKGGATSMQNLQYLCKSHNGRKSAWVPTRTYRWRLERRRRSYFPPDQPRKVSWSLSEKQYQYETITYGDPVKARKGPSGGSFSLSIYRKKPNG